jgi:hypothetical protein
METGKKLMDTVEQGEKITRKQAIKKAGVTALAASSLLLLNTQAKAQASGATGNPGNNMPVGNAGENPNGQDNWGSGDQGVSR